MSTAEQQKFNDGGLTLVDEVPGSGYDNSVLGDGPVQGAQPQPTEDQKDLMAAYGTLQAALVAFSLADEDQQTMLLLGAIEAVVKQLDARMVKAIQDQYQAWINL